MVPEISSSTWYKILGIWSKTDRILSHFGLFFALPCPPLLTKRINGDKTHKTHGDIIILHRCTKNHDDGLYCSWYMASDRCNCYFLFWAILFPLPPPPPPPNSPKNKNIKKWWKYLEISPFYQKFMIICYTAPEIWQSQMYRCNCYFLFWAICCPFTPPPPPPNSPDDEHFFKMKITPGDIII